jgi:hypothetical protein
MPRAAADAAANAAINPAVNPAVNTTGASAANSDGVASAPAASPKAKDRLALWLLCAPVVATSIFGKFAVPPFGKLGLGLGFPLAFMALLIALFTGRLAIDSRRAAYYALMAGVMLAVQVARQEPFSMMSVVFMMTVNLTYVLNIRGGSNNIDDAMRFFARLALFIAVCGIVQFFAQFLVGTRNAFPIENLVPKNFVISGFHYLNPLSFGSSTYKANGIFMQEPSFFSQLVAIGLIVEMTLYKRIVPILVMALAMMVSYSGTGLLILAVSVPVLLISKRRLDLLAIIFLALFFCVLFAAPLRLTALIDRIGEFGNLNSSASMRFVSWVFLLGDTLFNDTARLLFGYGPGSFRDVALLVPFPVAEMMHSKMLVEYGVLGFLAYLGFICYCIFTSPAPGPVKLAVLVMHFMAGAYAEPVVGVALTLVLLTPRVFEKKTRLATRFVPPKQPRPRGLRRTLVAAVAAAPGVSPGVEPGLRSFARGV